MASVDGQITGLVPANYVKILGKRRGRNHAEMVKLQQVQQDDSREALQTHSPASPQSHLTQDFSSGFSLTPSTAPSEELLESVYAETPGTRLTKPDPTRQTCDACE